MADYSKFPLINPELQLSFWYRLQIVKEKFFSEALLKTISEIPAKTISDQLAKFVKDEQRQRVAALGLRDELIFMLPCVIRKNPQLIGYYRLLFGLSQKELYKKQYAKFKKLEEDNTISFKTNKFIEILCERFIECASIFLSEIDSIDSSDIHDLQLLTALLHGSQAPN